MGKKTVPHGASTEPGRAPECDNQTQVDIETEQRYLDHAYRCLNQMSIRAGRAADDAAHRAPGDWDATVAHLHLTRRLASLNPDSGPLCFGRTDEEDGLSWHIGRRHVEDESGEPVVVDWRAPVSVPFYRATYRDPLGLIRRRRFVLDGRNLVDLLDEDFDDAASAEQVAGSGLPDPLLAELGRARTGVMRDIVATIAAEQDLVIRAPMNRPVVVQGGPGTGKTAVGLHRAAFLLYEHRAQLERQGVLVLGPNRIFLEYISQVLPSLGEVSVVQTTLSGLVGQWPPRGTEPATVAELKGDIRMADVLAKACTQALGPSSRDLVATTRWGSVTVPATDVQELLDAAFDSGGALGQRRTRFRRGVAQRVVRRLAGRRRDVVIDPDAINADIRSDRVLQRDLERIWPSQSPASVLRSLLGGEATLVAAAGETLTQSEQDLLRRRPARAVSNETWTLADLPLLDEIDSLLNGPSRRYGHIVIDEAQDLSPMALRMVARRSADGRSVTVLGDLAQATAPGSLREWSTALKAFDAHEADAIRELTIGYRVPSEIMALANRLLAATSPQLPRTESVRVTGEPPTFITRQRSDLTAAAREAAEQLQDLLSLGVIATDRHQELQKELQAARLTVAAPGRAHDVPHVSLLKPDEAKGLEFDAVIVIEPADFLALPGGPGLLYIALTRAVQHLSIIHTKPLPKPLLAGCS